MDSGNKHRRCFRKNFFVFRKNSGECPKKIFDSQNGTLTENCFWRRGEGVGEVAEKIFLVGAKSGRKGPPTQNMPKGPVFLLTLLSSSSVFSHLSVDAYVFCLNYV